MAPTMIISWIVQFLIVPVLSPLSIGLTRKIKAKLQNRVGASIFQPYRDLWKLFNKNEVVSLDASWIFLFAPYIVFATTLLVASGIPMVNVAFQNIVTGDLLVIVYMVAFGTFFLALAGLDVGGGFGGFGSSREMMVSALTEGGLILSLLTLALISHSTNLFTIASTISTISFLNFTPIILAFVSFIIAMLAETSRYPFDNPATHLELTMIHEAMLLEYSGKRLALMEWASANKYLIFLSLAVNLFFPWGIAQSISLSAITFATAVFILKVALLSILVAVLESSIAKFRIFRLPDLMFTSLAISMIAVGLII